MPNQIYPSYLAAAAPVKVIELAEYARRYHLTGRFLGAVLFEGVTGTCLDNVAAGMLAMAVQSGKLQKGKPIIEASSGTFGAALALAGRRLGHPVYLVMPLTVDDERQHLLRCLGASIFTTDPLYGRDGCLKKARQLAQENGGYFVNYFDNDDNPEYHRRVTGPALLAGCAGELDYIVAGVGSAGTVCGVAEYTKARTSRIKIIAVEPYECSVLSGGFAGKHGIPGLGPGFIPANYNDAVIDGVMTATTTEALKTAQELLQLEGIPAAPATGAVVCAARKLMQQPENAGKRIVALMGARQELF